MRRQTSGLPIDKHPSASPCRGRGRIQHGLSLLRRTTEDLGEPVAQRIGQHDAPSRAVAELVFVIL
jgi:hypothetical protein